MYRKGILMKIILVRHGLTEANIKKTYSLQNTKLHESAYKELEKTKILLNDYKIDKVYTSELIRSQETAKFLGYDEFIKDRRLNEMDFGDFKGQSLKFVREKYADFFKEEELNYFDIPYPNGESRVDVIKRTSGFLEEISKEEGNILCFSHGIALSLIHI